MRKLSVMLALILLFSTVLAFSAEAAVSYELSCWYANKYNATDYMIGRWGKTNPTYSCVEITPGRYGNVPLSEKTGASITQWNSALGTSASAGTGNGTDIRVFLGTRVEIDAFLDAYNEALAASAVGYTKPEFVSDGVTFTKGQIEAECKQYLSANVYIVHISGKTDAQYYNTILHEMGHAFGYMGEGLYANDVMCPTPNGVTTLTTRDKQHLSQVYDYWRNH